MMRNLAHEFARVLFPVIVAFCLPCSEVSGQISLPGEPCPLWYEGAQQISIQNFAIPEETQSDYLYTESSLLKPAGFYRLYKISVQPSLHGTWDTLDDGRKIWRYAVSIDNASYINVNFSSYKLNKGVRVYIYDVNQQYIIGAFSDLNNKPSGLLATATIPGNTAIVEMQVPAFIHSYGTLAISELGYDFENVEQKTSKDPWFGKSGWCNTDVNCIQSKTVARVKNSVVRIVFNGNQRCTGTLLNTVEKNGSNYILTAAHCFTKYIHDKPFPAETAANKAVFYFNYELPDCNGLPGFRQHTISGASIRAWSDEYDLTLLELLEPVPFYYQPYYAGWDYSGKNPQGSFTIHHPWGDIKKISVENDSLKISSFPNDKKTNYAGSSHWLVSRWEVGTTEAGSSGAPLFDKFGRLTGTLTGGLASCNNPIRDYFQMFSRSWRNNLQPAHELSEWLDPYGRSKGFFDGYDPYASFWLTGDTISNIQNNESIFVENGGLSWGSYSGHNGELLSGFSEKYISGSSKVILGVLMHVAENNVVDPLSRIRVRIYNGDELPNVVLHEQKVYLVDLSPGINFISFDTAIASGNTFFVGYEIEYNAIPDTFSVFMAKREYPDTSNTAYVFNGMQWESLSSYTGGIINSSYSIFPLVYEGMPEELEKPELSRHISLYPNPARNIIQVVFNEFVSDPVTIVISNLEGKTMHEQSLGPYQRIIPVSLLNYAAGIYIIRISSGNSETNLKFGIVK